MYPDSEGFFAALGQWPVKAVRANTHLVSIEELAQQWNVPCDYVPWCKDAMYFDWDQRLGTTAQHERGLCYIGDAGAMLPIESLDIAHDAVVVDMCAAPGGKSIHALNKLSSCGQLIANDVDVSRVKKLKDNMQRVTRGIVESHLPTVKIESMSARELSDSYCSQADVVILDAPCSGEAMMRRSNTARRQWSEKLVQKMANVQRELFKAALDIAKPGGQIVYSTCTFNSEENEKVIESFLHAISAASGRSIQQRFPEPIGIARELSLSLYPHLSRADGQSVMVAVKN